MEKQLSSERTPIKKFINAQGKLCKTVDFANDEASKRALEDAANINTSSSTTVNTPDLFFEVVRFWAKQVVDPDESLSVWGEQEFTLANGDTGLFHNFSVLFNKGPTSHLLNLEVASTASSPNTTTINTNNAAVAVPKSPCQSKQFFDLCKLLIPGFKKPQSSAVIILPPKSQVRTRLQQFVSQLSQVTFPLQDCLFQQHGGGSSIATPTSIQPLHLVITPGFYRSPDNKDNSILVYYDITTTGRLVQASQMTQTRLCDMQTIHPMFASSLWSHFLYMVATLAHLHDLFIYFRYDVGRFYQYVVVHEQCFEISQLEEQRTIDHAPRLSMQMQATLEEQDMVQGIFPMWQCDVDAADLATPKETYNSQDYRGLKIRLVFRQNYSRWFF